MENYFVTGSSGQIGSELISFLRKKFPQKRILALDIRPKFYQESDPDFIQVDLLNSSDLGKLFEIYKPVAVYHLAAILSAKGESNPLESWNLNMGTLLNILNFSVQFRVKQVFWPSSIAVHGPIPKIPYNIQQENLEPITSYGIAKLAGENWCHYFREHYNLDVRSIRFPGLISYKSKPGGGTTDYSVEIYSEALKSHKYTSYLQKNTLLPMMYMEDAIRSIVEIMGVPKDSLKSNLAYNIAGFSASPEDFEKSIQEFIPDFHLDYVHFDPRQSIADSWPNSILDEEARRDWNWRPRYDLNSTTREMMNHLKENLQESSLS